MTGRIISAAVGRRSRWIVIGTWLALAIALGALQPKLQHRAEDESETFRARGAESTRVHHLLESRFKEGHDSTATIVYVADHGSIDTYTGLVAADQGKLCATEALPNLKGVVAAGALACGDVGHELGPQQPPSPFSADDPHTAVLVTVVNGKKDTASVARDVAVIRRVTPGPNGKPVRSYVAGQAGFDADRTAAVEGIDGTLLAITMILVVVLMLVMYRSPAIAGTMLGVVLIAYLVATGLVYGLLVAGATTVSGQSTAILIVLMFGAGTDYCLLIVSRYREELRRDGNPETAMTRAMQRTGPTILASGAIVVASMCVLALADFNATRELGPILGLGIIVMGICAVTLLPALLVAIGQRAFWPTRVVVGEVSARSPLWSRVGGLVRRRPLLLVSVSTLVLLAGALGNIGGRGYLDVTDEYRVPTESVLGQQVVRERYHPAGRIAPLDIVSSSGEALQVKDALAEARGVAASNTDSQSRDGKLIASQVLLNVDPFSTKAMDLVPSLRKVAKQSGSTALIGGVAAENYDNRAALQRDTKLIVPIVLLLILLVLIALLRSVVAPLYVMGSVILSFAFALGASSLVFTHVFGQPDSDPNETIFAFIFLIALGVDDNIFLMTRIREEYRRGVGARDAVISGLEQTGGVITAAGLILAGTFASLMALQLEALFQVGFIVALGLLVDAFVVRTFLVPAVAVLLGDRSWWPARARHAP